MTLKEFREQTKDFPDHLDLFVGERLTEFKYGSINSIERKEINFSEEPDGEVEARGEVIILCED